MSKLLIFMAIDHVVPKSNTTVENSIPLLFDLQIQVYEAVLLLIMLAEITMSAGVTMPSAHVREEL